MSTFTEKFPPDRGKRKALMVISTTIKNETERICFQKTFFGSQGTQRCFEDIDEQDIESTSSKCQHRKHLEKSE